MRGKESPVVRSHTLAAWSSLVVTARAPSLASATATTSLVARKGVQQLPVVRSHTLAVWSTLVVTARVPSLLPYRLDKARVAAESVQRVTGGQVPHDRGPVVASGDSPRLVAGDRYRSNPIVVAGEGVPRRAGGQVPHDRRAVALAVTARVPSPVAATAVTISGGGWGCSGTAPGEVPHNSRIVFAGSYCPRAVARNRYCDIEPVTSKGKQRGTGGQVPHDRRPVLAAGDRPRAVTRAASAIHRQNHRTGGR